MTKEEIIDYVESLTKPEKHILACFEGENELPESIEKLWDRVALKKLIDYDLVKWTVYGFELTEDGKPLARYIDELERKLEEQHVK